MDREVEFNTELTKIHHKNYVRNSRAVTVAWFIFCACYTILNVVAFVQPFWVGDTDESPGVGYFGVYEWCERIQGSEFDCKGDFLDFNTISNNYFMASSFLVGCAALLFIMSIIGMILFMFMKPTSVLRICGWLQLIAGLFMAVACIVYPNGFDDPNFQRICGQNAKAYDMDKCQIRWAYILAIVLIFDAFILSILAFILASCQAKMIPEMEEKKEDSSRYIYDWQENGFVNNVFEDTSAPDEITPRIVPQSLRHRQKQTQFQSDYSQGPMTEPLVIPVVSFGDSSNGSNPSATTRSDPPSRSESLSKPETPLSDQSISPRDFEEFGDVNGTDVENHENETSEDIHL